MAGHKQYDPLTGEQQRLVERAWAETNPLRRQLCRQYPQIGLEVDGLVAEAFCRRIRYFDADRASLRTWAVREAWYAMRREFAYRSGYRTGTRPPTGWYRLRADSLSQLKQSHLSELAVYDPPSQMEIEEAIAERARTA